MRRAPFVIIAVAAVAVVAIAAFAVTRLLGGNPKEAAGASGMGNSVTNIAVGEGQAVSAGGMDYYFDGNGLERAKANDPGSVKQICSISSDGTHVGMLNYADGNLFYVQEEDSSYDIKSVKADGSDEETLYSLDVEAGHNNSPGSILWTGESTSSICTSRTQRTIRMQRIPCASLAWRRMGRT